MSWERLRGTRITRLSAPAAPARRWIIHQRMPLAAVILAVLTCLAGCGAASPSTAAAGSSATDSLCGATQARGIVDDLLAAFDDGNVRKLDKLVSANDFAWWSTDAPGERIDPEARDRSTLMAYFANRHLHQERLVMLSFKFNSRSGNVGNFEVSLIRSAEGLPPTPYVGKGAVDCLTIPPRSVVAWSMARNPHPSSLG